MPEPITKSYSWLHIAPSHPIECSTRTCNNPATMQRDVVVGSIKMIQYCCFDCVEELGDL